MAEGNFKKRRDGLVINTGDEYQKYLLQKESAKSLAETKKELGNTKQEMSTIRSELAQIKELLTQLIGSN